MLLITYLDRAEFFLIFQDTVILNAGTQSQSSHRTAQPSGRGQTSCVGR